MNDAVIYRPYKTQTWALVITVPIGMLAFVGAGYFPISCLSFLFFIGIGIACILLTKVLYDASKRAVSFDEKGLQIIDRNSFDYRHIPWEELSYACYARNYKGHLFLILSPNALSHKEAKRFANRGANSLRICIDDVVVLYMDVLQDVSHVMELIDNHVLRVDTY